MSNTKKAFARGKAFIPFLTCGDPDLDTTEKLVPALAAAGADLIELGVPFSDPTAEGPVIQAANLRALAGGVTTDKIFAMVERLRRVTDVPLAFMTYANVVFSRGADRFAARMAETGVDALILPDVPLEEKEEFAAPCRAHGVDFISLVAPTSAARTERIAREAEGFVYCVSSLGVTGERAALSDRAADIVGRVKAVQQIPCAVGFGISTPAQAAAVSRFADGVIVGSAIVRLIAEHGKDCIPFVTEYVRSMKNAISNV